MSSLGNARVSVLFANGTFGIWELDARNELKAVRQFFLWPGCPCSILVHVYCAVTTGTLVIVQLELAECGAKGASLLAQVIQCRTDQ